MSLEWISKLESRRLLSTVNAHVRLLGDESTIGAGQSVSVDALGTATAKGSTFGSGGSAVSSEITWNFGDTKGSYNHLVGFNAVHAYNKPGKYKITLHVTNKKGITDTASRMITVKKAALQAIYVNPWGNDKNNGKTPDTAVASAKRAGQLLTDNTALYFRRGQTFQVNNTINVPFSNVQISAYGKGKTPRLELMSGDGDTAIFGTTSDSHQVSIGNLLLESNTKKDQFGTGVYAAGTNVTVRGMDFEHLNNAIQASGAPSGFLVQSNTAGPLKSYFAYVKGSDQAFLGNTAGDSLTQHNIRIYGSRILCYGNDLTNLAEGSSLATLRVNDGSNIYWADNVLHGGQMLIGPLGPGNPGATSDASVSNIVVEGNTWEEVKGHWSNHTRVQINAGVSSIMVRNNVIDGTNATAISASTFEHQKFKSGAVDRTVTNLQVLDNTVLNPGTMGAFLSVTGDEPDAITLKNSLYVAPSLDIGRNTAAAVRVLGRNDLDNFTPVAQGGGISGNVWNLPPGALDHGVNYVGTKSAGDTNYRTPTEWATQFPAQVSHDTFEKLLMSQLNSNFAPPVKSMASSFSTPVSGVFTDLIGELRPQADWTAGAVQV